MGSAHRLFAVLAALSGFALGAWSAEPFAGHPINEWVRQSPREGKPIPAWQWEGSGDYVPQLDGWIHQGGHDRGPQGFAVFLYDLKTRAWRQKFPNTSPPGNCCVDGSNCFAVADGVFVKFPGAAMGHGGQFGRGVGLKKSLAWVYDPIVNRWTNMRPPPYKAAQKYSREVPGSLCSSGTYDPNHEVAVTFGGQTTGGGSDATWVYDPYSNTMEKMDAAKRPGRRDGSGLSYDADLGRLVLFGSQYGNDEKTYLYRYDTNKWEAHATDPHPPGRKGSKTYSTIPKMVYDPLNKVHVLVAWLGEGPHETWILDAAKMQWRKASPAVEPPGSRSRTRNVGFSRKHNLVLLEIENAKTRRPQLWSYRVAERPADPRPEPPTGLTVVTSPTGATLRWTASASDGVTGYAVYKAVADRPWRTKFAKVVTVAGTSWTDPTLKLEAGAVAYYRVRAVAGALQGRPSFQARAQPRAAPALQVSAVATNRIEVTWNAHPQEDVVGYNLYRGRVSVKTITKGPQTKYRASDPAYPEPLIYGVRDIADLRKLNDTPLSETKWVDTTVDLTAKGEQNADYKYAVFAYIVRSVNRLGVESGPSPYALTIPSAPQNVMVREDGKVAHVRWESTGEKSVAGYRIYRVSTASQYAYERVTSALVTGTTYRDRPGGRTRYVVVPVDVLGQEGEPSSPAWFRHSYKGFYKGQWHQ